MVNTSVSPCDCGGRAGSAMEPRKSGSYTNSSRCAGPFGEELVAVNKADEAAQPLEMWSDRIEQSRSFKKEDDHVQILLRRQTTRTPLHSGWNSAAISRIRPRSVHGRLAEPARPPSHSLSPGQPRRQGCCPIALGNPSSNNVPKNSLTKPGA